MRFLTEVKSNSKRTTILSGLTFSSSSLILDIFGEDNLILQILGIGIILSKLLDLIGRIIGLTWSWFSENSLLFAIILTCTLRNIKVSTQPTMFVWYRGTKNRIRSGVSNKSPFSSLVCVHEEDTSNRCSRLHRLPHIFGTEKFRRCGNYFSRLAQARISYLHDPSPERSFA